MPPLTRDDVDWEMIGALLPRVNSEHWEDFLDQGQGCNWCRHPVRIRGVVVEGEGQGRSLRFSTDSLPDGVFLKACGSRRETRCPACAHTYRADARHLVRAGLIGGKGVDESVSLHPAVLLTLTAPSFGVVHTARSGATCRSGHPPYRCIHDRPTTCAAHHHADDDLVSTPLCPDCYDYEAAILHNAHTPELWRRTTIYLHRQLAAVLELTQAETRRVVRLSFCRVAEYQRRGIVHLHAIIRADTPEGGLPPVAVDELSLACVRATKTVRVVHSRGEVAWGSQVDVQVLDRDEGRAKRIASYVAKYATKSTEDSGVLDRPIRTDEDLASRLLTPHLRKMLETAWALGEDPELSNLHLRRYAHTLGFNGQFLTKSRRYSSTFANLRAERAQWREERRHRGVAPPEHTASECLLDADCWEVVGVGWANRGEARFADSRWEQRLDELHAANEDRYTL
jgi:hypothetical protein